MAPSVVAGKFHIEGVLGRGGMGEVFVARDPTLGNRKVAIKLPRLDGNDIRQRFRQEARAAASLHHPNIVIIYEYGEYQDQPYLAMEYIEGVPLSTLIRQRQPASLLERLDLIDDLCAGLAYAHQQGVVHRDVKPGNLMVDRHHRLKILDFGIARITSASATSVGIATVGVVGTPNYMSPEQIGGDPIDHRTDIFAVGAVAYELIAFRMAFPGASARAYDHIRYTEPEPLDSVVPDCVPRLAQIVRRATAKDPENRYQDLGEMRADLAVVRRSAGLSSAPLDSNSTVVQPRTPTPTPGGVDRAALARRREQIVSRYIGAGSAALDRGELEAAIDQLEQAISLDETNPQALDLLELARARVTEAECSRTLDEAEGRLGLADLEGASALVSRVLEQSPSHERARGLRDRIEGRKRVVAAIATAKTELGRGAAEVALRAASEALALEPSNGEALQLTRQALEFIAEQHQRARTVPAREAVADTSAAGRGSEPELQRAAATRAEAPVRDAERAKAEEAEALAGGTAASGTAPAIRRRAPMSRARALQIAAVFLLVVAGGIAIRWSSGTLNRPARGTPPAASTPPSTLPPATTTTVAEQPTATPDGQGIPPSPPTPVPPRGPEPMRLPATAARGATGATTRGESSRQERTDRAVVSSPSPVPASNAPQAPAPVPAIDERRARRLRQANALVETRLFDAAIAIYDELLKSNPDDAEAAADRATAVQLREQRQP
jgi:serine/threonine protein kinase